jgi:membrane protease YdiL (CAAX protease family)
MLAGYIRSLSPTMELWIVLLVAFALPIARSQMYLLDPTGFEPSNLRGLVIEESAVLLALGYFLSIRGWDFAGLTAHPSWLDGLMGVVFSLMFMQAWSVAWRGLQFFVPQFLLASNTEFTLGLDFPTLLAICVINPIFEELLVCGYVISAVSARYGLNFAIGTSVFIRCAYHTYQGLEGVGCMMLLGIFFAIWFVRTGRLWPLIIAHAVGDFLGLVRSTLV